MLYQPLTCDQKWREQAFLSLIEANNWWYFTNIEDIEHFEKEWWEIRAEDAQWRRKQALESAKFWHVECTDHHWIGERRYWRCTKCKQIRLLNIE